VIQQTTIDDYDLKLALETIIDGGGPYSRQRRVSRETRNYHLYARRWSRAHGIRGFGIGLRQASGRFISDLGLTVFVDRKRPRSALQNPIPRQLCVPGVERKILVDVQEIGRGQLQQGHTALGGGSKIRHFRDPPPAYGTLGCLVRDQNEPTKLYILSNMHVLALAGAAARGEDICAVREDESTGAVIGKLTRWIPYLPGPGFPNSVDAAIAEVVSDEVSPNVGNLGPTGLSNLYFPGMAVHIQGARSGQKNSMVVTVDASIEMDLGSQGTYGFRDQVVCVDYTNRGDSGSCVLNDRGRAVGLHFWGTDGQKDGVAGEISVFSPMKNVLAAFEPAFKLEIVTVDGTRDLSGLTGVAAPTPVTTPIPPTVGSIPPVDHREDAIDVMARTIWGEARGEEPDGMKGVSEVIYNRAMKRSRRFGETIEAVCRKPSQFSCWNTGDPNLGKLQRVDGSDAQFQICLQVAKLVVNGDVTTLTNGADHYYDGRIQVPSWAIGHTACAQIKHHLFFNDIP
jgi:spore germination cell wall hydrolase CwlJ-like protein